MFNRQMRIVIITVISLLAAPQACYAEEILQADEVCLFEYSEDTMSSDMGVVCLDSESDNAVNEKDIPVNTFLAGLKTDIRSLFAGMSGIDGYRISNKRVASCRKNGIFKGKNTGRAVIEAYDSSKTTVSSVEIHVIKQKLFFPKNFSIASFNAADYLIDSTFTPDKWESSKPSVASIDPATGMITVKSKGKTKISAVYQTNGSTKKITGTLKVKNSIGHGGSGLDGKHSVTIDTDNGTKNLSVKYDASEAERVFELVNEYRQKNNLPAFKHHTELQKAADLRAAEIVVSFSHERPNGTMCTDVFPPYYAAAENIAKGQTSASSVMSSWKNSTGHNANMLTEACTCLAVSCVSYKGTKYWVQCFYASRE